MSATQKQTPGVYIQEINAFPNSVVEVATAIPVFIGYTEKALNGNIQLKGVPKRISSFAEYMLYYGQGAATKVTLSADGKTATGLDKSTRFFMFGSLRLYFDNGGGPCWIMSVGTYDEAKANGKSAAALGADAMQVLKKCLEPTMVVVPDAVLLDAPTDSRSVANQVLQHCADMQSRIGIFDIFNGDQKRTNDALDVISGDTGFRTLTSDSFKYGVAYYPWLNTSLIEDSEVDYSCLSDDAKGALVTNLSAVADASFPEPRDAPTQAKLDQLKAEIVKIAVPEPVPSTPDAVTKRRNTHNILFTVMPAYKTLMGEVKTRLNVLPPSGGIAGVYARIDDLIGVQKAPANTGIASVVGPVVDINHDEQEDLNVPLNGMAVNAIRTMPGKGMLIWGARTLDGNSQDWRYVNVRRTMIMLEQSIKTAAEAYVFEPNNALTWSTVKSMIENFLTNQWKAGVLMGSKPADAFSVDVGLGSTMTGNDVLDGYMRVSVKVCVVRPAEFIVITFQQLMPTS
jgi:phage tail sheath protein FI